MDYKDYIVDVIDFPTKGIVFKDSSPLIASGGAFSSVIDELSRFTSSLKADVIIGPEARGFIFGCPVATKLGIGFVPARKPGKLPRKTISETYALEYGENSLHIHIDAIKKGDRVVIIDDLLATGGTIRAIEKIVKRAGGIVVGVGVLIELEFLNGRNELNDLLIKSLVKY